MEKNKDDKVTVSEFINIWSECDKILKDNIQQGNEKLQYKKAQKIKCVFF
jgi:hypothetical protein